MNYSVLHLPLSSYKDGIILKGHKLLQKQYDSMPQTVHKSFSIVIYTDFLTGIEVRLQMVRPTYFNISMNIIIMLEEIP